MVMRPLLLSALSVAVLAACTVGPDYVRPSGPDVAHFVRNENTEAPLPQAQVEFWHAFGDAQLDRLVGAALLHNNDLRAALANYDQANALLRGSRYDQLPTLTASGVVSSVRDSADELPGYTRDQRDFHEDKGTIGFNWELDFFGRVRREVQANRADAQASADDLAAMQVAVVGELARTYFQLRGWQQQLRIARENADSQQRTLDLLQVRVNAGMDDAFDVNRGRAQLESTQAQIPALQAQVATAAHRIAVLIGQPPEALVAELEAPAALPVMPQNIAVDAPGDLLRRRPDVSAAERRLAAASARIGVATGDLFPKFSLGGLIGTDATSASALFKRDSETRLLSLGIDGSFLNVGRVRAEIAAAKAGNEAALANYDKAVLGALEDTENALVQVARSGDEVAHLQEAATASENATRLAQVRFDDGAISVLDLLDAQRSNLQTEDALARGKTRNAVAVAALYQAIAGGWPNHVPKESVAKK